MFVVLCLIVSTSMVNCNIVQMDKRCYIIGEVLLNCANFKEGGVDFEFAPQANTIIRIEVYRLNGYINLKNLALVDLIEVKIGEATCNQILNNANKVQLVLSSETLTCLVSKIHKLLSNLNNSYYAVCLCWT